MSPSIKTSGESLMGTDGVLLMTSGEPLDGVLLMSPSEGFS